VVEGTFEDMIDLDAVAGLDGDAVCAAAEAAHARLIAAEVEQFVLAAHWVDLHSGEALNDERRARGVRVLPGMERGKRAGADGTPWVAEFAAVELGAVLAMGPVAAECFTRDAVNVRHRHPVLWEALLAGRDRVWQARDVARRCAAAGLDREQAGWVDAVTTPYLASLPWGRFVALVEAKIVEADPAAAQERARAAAMARFVRTGESNEFGIRSVYARANAGDAVCFTAMVDRIAHVLAEHGDTDTVEVLRSKALGVLATPARALQLLLDAAPSDHDTGGVPASGEDGTPGDSGPFTGPGARAIAAALARVDPKRRCPRRRCTSTCPRSHCTTGVGWRGWRVWARSPSNRWSTFWATPTCE
jgi:hypothetical protein